MRENVCGTRSLWDIWLYSENMQDFMNHDRDILVCITTGRGYIDKNGVFMEKYFSRMERERTVIRELVKEILSASKKLRVLDKARTHVEKVTRGIIHGSDLKLLGDDEISRIYSCVDGLEVYRKNAELLEENLTHYGDFYFQKFRDLRNNLRDMILAVEREFLGKDYGS